MSEKELNSYRLTSMEEPTDEMLECIMHEAAQDAKERWEVAREQYFNQIATMAKEALAEAGL